MQVIIEGQSPSNEFGDIAIDDISFTSACMLATSPLPPGTTIASTTQQPCPGEDQFHCGDGTCILVDKYCDGKNFVLFDLTNNGFWNKG